MPARHDPLAVLTSDEATTLERFLDINRDEVGALLEGLTEEQARRRLVPSRTTLLGLVKHCAFVERVWFGEALGGTSRADLALPTTPDGSFDLTDEDTIASVLADHRSAVADSRVIAAGLDMDDLAEHNQRRGPLSLRWLHIHLIEEYARHAGHGDILREQILAADG